MKSPKRKMKSPQRKQQRFAIIGGRQAPRGLAAGRRPTADLTFRLFVARRGDSVGGPLFGKRGVAPRPACTLVSLFAFSDAGLFYNPHPIPQQTVCIYHIHAITSR